MKQIGLFEGYGGLSMAVADVLGAELVAYSEIDPGASRLLAHHHPEVPNLGDVTAIDWAAVPLDPDARLVLTGGFPCQDVSSAGRRAGLKPGTRSGLWSHMVYAIAQLHPDLVVIENVRGLLSADAACDLEPCPWCLGDDEGRPLRALGAVLGDLAELGYDARWVGLRAADVGAPHPRYRIFVAAWAAADTKGIGRREGRPQPARILGGLDAAGGGDAVQDSNSAVGSERRISEPGQAEGGRARPDAGRRGGAPVADPDGAGSQGRGLRERAGTALVRDGAPATAWGAYEPAVRRWELTLGRPAPAPTQTGMRGGQQLSPRFVEWMMGLPQGHVTGVPGLSRNEQLKLLGNGVVPQQAAAALRHLLGAAHGMERAA